MTGRVRVTQEDDSGRNKRFKDTRTGREMTRAQFIGRIEQGEYDAYHVRNVGGVKTPASNPDGKKGNNLG